MHVRNAVIVLVVMISSLAACSARESIPTIHNHSYARPQDAAVTHISLDLEADFDRQRLKGKAALTIENRTGVDKLYLDVSSLDVRRVTLGNEEIETNFNVGVPVSFIGSALTIDIAPDTKLVTVYYETTERSGGVQWLEAQQTAGGRQPFLFTQSQAILARSWVPCQDSPETRVTYDARIKTRPGLLVLMSARNGTTRSADGVYEFTMPQPIPTYLLALVIGDLEYRAISERCGVYAEPELADAARWEFEDMEKMMVAAEQLYGAYRWERFDVVVLPPSFPYGGMENPRLTFTTPILVAGDRSLVSTIAHELAHSWSGNLVTMSTWDDFWLNEGFTTYFEARIMERLYGRQISEMNALMGYQRLQDEIETDPDELDTALHIPLNGRDPDEELGWAPYEKGYLFLRLLEETVGREKFDDFLRGYFNKFAFTTMTSERFVAYMKSELLGNDEQLYRSLLIDEWVWKGGLPANSPRPKSDRFDRVEVEAASYLAGTAAAQLHTKDWTSPEWQHFLSKLDSPLTAAQMQELDENFGLVKSNGEVQRSWFLHVISDRYEPHYGALEEYLVRVGRRWLVRPLYTKLAETEEGRLLAQKIYKRARPGYHSVTVTTIDAILNWPAAQK